MSFYFAMLKEKELERERRGYRVCMCMLPSYKKISNDIILPPHIKLYSALILLYARSNLFEWKNFGECMYALYILCIV